MQLPDQSIPIVDPVGRTRLPFQLFLQAVAGLIPLKGSGSPEGVIEGYQTQLYMDMAGTAGSILYVKRDNDIGGDTTRGWILV